MENQNTTNDGNLAVPSPKQSPNKQKIIFGIVAFVILPVAAGAVYFYFSGNGSKQIVKQLQPPQQLSQADISAQDISLFISKSAVVFPKTASMALVASSTIPSALYKFVTDDAENLQTLQVSFQGGKTGSRLIYTTPKSIQDLRAQFNEPLGWTTTAGFLSDNAALWTFENQNFQVQIIETFLTASATRVSVLGLDK
jgi:hypothetical protein